MDRGWLLVVGSWGLAGASAGMALGATQQLTRGVAGAASAWGVAGVAVGGLCGVGAYLVERRWARGLPALWNERGELEHPRHGALYAAPIAVVVPSMVWLGVLGVVAGGSVAPAFVGGGVAFMMLWAGRRVWGAHRLNRALQQLEAGREEAAAAQLRHLAQTWILYRRQVRDTATLHLAVLALNAGRIREAAGLYARVRGGTAAAWALVGRALCLLLLEERVPAAEALSNALVHPAARHVQAEADAVRVLLVGRTEGQGEGDALGERLLGPGAAPLLKALVAAARRRRGDWEGAMALTEAAGVQALLASGLVAHVPELLEA